MSCEETAAIGRLESSHGSRSILASLTAGILGIGILIAGSFAQASQPGIRSFVAGGSHNLVLKTDGALWAWGYNGVGQLGDGTQISKTSPVQVGIDTDWAAVTAGRSHNLALKTDGTLWAWGSNGAGQLANADTSWIKKSPVKVGIDTDWTAVSAGQYHSLALKTNGTLWAWGANGAGQLGDGTQISKTSPVQVGIDTDWAAVTAGGRHTIALKTDGTLWAWGYNFHGQLGDGTTVGKDSPVKVGLATDWVEVRAGFEHTLALKAGGTLFKFPSNRIDFQVDNATDWAATAAGWYHSLALKTDGTLWTWGYNYYGQLGDGTTLDKWTPIQVDNATDCPATWTATAAGWYHSLALKTDGTLWAWGSNSGGQLGDGTTVDKYSPVPVLLPPFDSPPVANAGADFSVNEAQEVMLDGRLSSDSDNDPLAFAWTQVSGPDVTLTGGDTATPTFTAPIVAIGGQTLSFELTVTANGETSTDTVSVTVVNVNHPPVADAGTDQSIAEGSPVTLHGEESFDIDNDVFTYAWTQVSGPTVTLAGGETVNPTFTAPYAGTGGAAGVVATIVFELLVDDGYPADTPASGYTLANVFDRVTVDITNTNNPPVADAGADQTVDENSAVALSGAASSDPDSDTLAYAWTQTGGPAVALTGDATATPSFTAPFVSVGGADLEFVLTVDDGYGATATDTVVIHVQNSNDPPLVSAAQPTISVMWPPSHQMVAVGITGVSDPDNDATITITGVTQDEPTNGLGDGDTAIDAVINADGTVLLRAERSGNGDGRVYRISFTASDLEGSASGVVLVKVPQNMKKPAIDSGVVFDSTN